MEYQIPFFVNEILSQLQAINMHLLDINKQNILNAEFTAEEVLSKDNLLKVQMAFQCYFILSFKASWENS